MNAAAQDRVRSIASRPLAGRFYTTLAVAALMLSFSGNTILVIASAATLFVIWVGAFTSPFGTIVASYLSFQWAQASAKVLLANIFGVNLSTPQVVSLCANCLLEVVDQTPSAILLALAAIAMTSLGARCFAPDDTKFKVDADGFSPWALLIAYLFLLAISRLSAPLAFGGFSQAVIVVGAMKFVPIILLTFGWITSNRGGKQLLIACLIELGLGFTGFFGGFTAVFVAGGIAVLVLASSHWHRVAPALAVGIPLVFLFGAVWTAIKPSYRAILNQGTQSQTVLIGMDERLEALADLSGRLGTEELTQGLVSLGLRLSYVDFLALVLQQVPHARPHEGGKLWGESFYHVLTPRFLFPDKPPLPSDSERTIAYSGRTVASGDKGTSISIGYVGESYIDFGIFGALAVSFVLGTLYAFLARHILALSRGRDFAFSVSVLIVVFAPIRAFEASNMKMFPGLLWSWIVGVIVVSLVWKWARPLLVTRPVLSPLPDMSNAGVRGPSIHGRYGRLNKRQPRKTAGF